MKLMLKLQAVPAVNDELLVQSDGVPFPSVCVKLAPTVTAEIMRFALPPFWTVTDCGLSLLVPPTGVDWKVKAGACERSSSTTWLSLESPMNTSPDPSSATAHGLWNPLPTVGQPACGHPPTGTSATSLFPASATNTSPAASTAMPIGEPKPPATVTACELPDDTSSSLPDPLSATKRSPALSTARPRGLLHPLPIDHRRASARWHFEHLVAHIGDKHIARAVHCDTARAL